MIAAGTLKHVVTFQRYTETQNEFGEVIQGWYDLFTTHAAIKPLTSKEIFASQTTLNINTKKVFIRYQEDIQTADRILFNDKIFSITGILNHDEKNIMLEILCEENNI